MKKAVLYVGNFLYPDGNAAGKRVHGNIKAIESQGYSTAVLCFRKTAGTDYLEKPDNKQNVFTIPYSDGISRLNNKKPYDAFKEVMKLVTSQLDVFCVVMYTTLGTMDFNLKVIKYCKQRGIKIVYDFCDYFEDISKSNWIKYFIKARDLFLLRNNVIKSCDGLITISSYLEKMVNRPGKTIVVPPLSVDNANIAKAFEKDCTHTIFSYASFVSDKSRPVGEWKDRIDAIIDIFYILKKQFGIDSFELHFIGFGEDALLEMFLQEYRESYHKKILELADNLVFYGQKSNREVQALLLESDYTVLLRDSKTSTNAGFPTKVSESIALGIPVVVNITSDIEKYIVDGFNGVVLSTPLNIELDAKKLKSLFEEGTNKQRMMKKNTEGNNPFYYAYYGKDICEFLNKI